MIEIIKGNLFDDKKLTVIAHGCNSFNTMGKGFALTLKNKYPKAYIANCSTKKDDINKLGTISCAIIDNIKIFNCYTQYTFWDSNRMLSYIAVDNCMKTINDLTTDKDIIGMPRIGCGLARGNWNTILDIIKNNLSNKNVRIYYL